MKTAPRVVAEVKTKNHVLIKLKVGLMGVACQITLSCSEYSLQD